MRFFIIYMYTRISYVLLIILTVSLPLKTLINIYTYMLLTFNIWPYHCKCAIKNLDQYYNYKLEPSPFEYLIFVYVQLITTLYAVLIRKIKKDWYFFFPILKKISTYIYAVKKKCARNYCRWELSNVCLSDNLIGTLQWKHNPRLMIKSLKIKNKMLNY